MGRLVIVLGVVCETCAIFVKKIQCFDGVSGVPVYWWTKEPGHGRELLMGLPPKDMTEWFSMTPVDRAQEITANMINKALVR